MRKLSLIILSILALVLMSGRLVADSPHGKDFKLSCDLCHSSTGWKLDKSIYSFDHSKTAFPLAGQHQVINCKQCHPTLVFSDAKTGCVDCHTDMHNQTVGPDCGRCHTPKSWIVENITEIHQRSRFPLVGPHYTADCNQCHPSASLLRFEPRGVECFDCHQENYLATTSPNHVQGNYSKNCIECHSLTSFTWSSTNVDHSFFPLKEGHAINDCNQCHTSGSYSNISKECFSCHLPNYNASINPNHVAASIPTTCADCHTTIPGWKPATFTIHNNYYALTGAHLSEDCNNCHSGGNYNNTPNVCVGCHLTNYNQTTNPNHAVLVIPTTCADCHTTDPGWKPATFDIHNNYYALTGAHTETDCNSCHPGGNYVNTPNACVGCHQENYNQTTNPNHAAIQIPTSCADCHTTNPDWKPATFAIHNTYYPLTGAHVNVSCNGCHNGNYNNTPNSCFGCHQADYNQTNNPPHASAQFPTDCQMCHTTSAWIPSTFNHDAQYFPIYSGKHQGEWNLCADCHINPTNYQIFSCIDCHEHNQTDMDDKHNGVPGYQYNSIACYTCHPTGSSGGKMPNSRSINPRK